MCLTCKGTDRCIKVLLMSTVLCLKTDGTYLLTFQKAIKKKITIKEFSGIVIVMYYMFNVLYILFEMKINEHVLSIVLKNKNKNNLLGMTSQTE